MDKFMIISSCLVIAIYYSAQPVASQRSRGPLCSEPWERFSFFCLRGRASFLSDRDNDQPRFTTTNAPRPTFRRPSNLPFGEIRSNLRQTLDNNVSPFSRRPTPAPTRAPRPARTRAPRPARTRAPRPAPTRAPRPAPRPAPQPAPRPAPRPSPSLRSGRDFSRIREQLKSQLTANNLLIAAWVQMAFHVCVGGCDGCLDLTNPSNKGLITTYTNVRNSHSQHADEISLADYVALHGVVAAEVGMEKPDGFIRFSTGRQTCPNPDSPNKGGEFPKGNDPNAMQVMIDELGMTREEGVVLLGAHSLGRCRPQNSGFDGAWDFSENKLDNAFYRSMQGANWEAVRTGNSTQWMRQDRALMMLLSDLTLMKQYTVAGPNDQPSCSRANSCPGSPTADLVSSLARDDEKFKGDFARVFEKMLSHSK